MNLDKKLFFPVLNDFFFMDKITNLLLQSKWIKVYLS
jgi:hypothetical protein